MENTGRYLPNTLRKNRRLLKYKQKISARIMKVNAADLSRWESNQTMPNVENLFKLSALYGLPCEVLMSSLYRKIKSEIEENKLYVLAKRQNEKKEKA